MDDAILINLRNEGSSGSLRPVWIYAGLLLAAYAIALAIYFGRAPGLLNARLLAGVLVPALLEVVAFLCASRWVLGSDASRPGWWRLGLHALVALAFGAAYLAQSYALTISNAFISPLALENAQDATLTVSCGQGGLLAAGIIAWLAMLAGTSRRAVPRVPRGRGWLLAVAGLAAVAGVVTFNHPVPPAGDMARLEAGQSPVTALLRSAVSKWRSAGSVALIPPSTVRKQLCDVQLGGGRWPFLKDVVNARPLPFAVTHSPARPNVVVIFMEGESARLFETYGGRYPGLTPNISRIAGQSMVVDNYFNHTAATYRGLQGQLTSGYPFRGGAENGAGWTAGDASGLATHAYASVPGILRQQGYRTVFFSPHQRAEALTPFVRMLGFDDVYTAARSRSGLLEHPDPLFNDALTDRDQFSALAAYLQRYRGDAPLFIGMYTLDTHAFLDIPAGGIPYGDGSNPSLNTLHTLDARIGVFYDYLRSSKYAADTLFVLTTDHAHYPEPPFVKVAGSGYKPYFVDRIPLLIHASWLPLPPRLDVHGRTSLDLAPTILQLLGVDQLPNSFLGHSLFERGYDRNFSIAAIGQAIYAIYRGEVYAPDEIPAQLGEGYAGCKALVQTYYAYENADAIFPASDASDAAGLDAGRAHDRNRPGTAVERQSANILARAQPVGSCALDTVDGRALMQDVPVSIRQGQPFVAAGWVVGADLQPPARFMFLLRDGGIYGFEGATGMPRPDVADALKAGSAGNAGFNMVVVTEGLPAGSYQVTALLKGSHGDQACDMHRQLDIRPP